MSINISETKIAPEGGVIAYKQVRRIGNKFWSRFRPESRDAPLAKEGADVHYRLGAVMEDKQGLGYYMFGTLAEARAYDDAGWTVGDYATLEVLIPFDTEYDSGDFHGRSAVRAKTIVVLRRV